MENSDRDEIERLRRIIAKLEETKQTQVITAEIVPREDKPGFLVYVTAPTQTSEVEFGMAIYSQVVSALRMKSPDAGIGKEPEFVDLKQAAPAAGIPEVELFAWVGRDEFGSGEIGLKQALVPAGTVPMISVDRGKLEKYWPVAEMQAGTHGQQISFVRFRAVEVLKRTAAGVAL